MQLNKIPPTQILFQIHNIKHMDHMVKIVTDPMINMEQTLYKIDKWTINRQFIQHNIQESDSFLPRILPVMDKILESDQI